MEPTPVKPIILIVGTSHVAKESGRRIKVAAQAFQPTHVAVELDRARLQSLRERAANPGAKNARPPIAMARQVGATGYLFLLVASWLQRKVGDILKVQPGLDMLAAVQIARERQVPLALVDQDVRVTLRRVSALFTAREKLRLVGDVIASPFSKRHRALARRVRLDRVPSERVVRELLDEMRERYPGLYRALVEERNAHMCARVDALARANPGVRILLVVGAAHEEDIRCRLRAVGAVDVE